MMASNGSSSRSSSGVIAECVLSTIWKLGARATDQDTRTRLLRSLLRRFPYWSHGHHLLAEDSLARDNVGCAYASALCMQALGFRSKHEQTCAEFILGRCFLRRGDWREALKYLGAASDSAPNNPRIKEERAAALILGGEMKAAQEILAAIPKHLISAEGKAALAFTSSKLGSS